MLTPALRFALISILVGVGVLLIPTRPYFSFLAFTWAVLFLIGYFRVGTVWIAFRVFRKGQIEKAGALLDRIPRPDWLNPQFKAYYHWIRGAQNLKAHRLEPAIEHLETAFRGDLKTTNARSGVALTMVQAYVEREDLEQAESWLEAARGLPHKESLQPIFQEFEDRLAQLRDPKLRDPVRIEGELVHLRDPVPEDAEAMVRWWTVDLAWTEWDSPWEAITHDEEKVRAGLLKQLARPPDLPRRRLMITLPDDTPIGRVNLYRIDGDDTRIALGINVHESRLWGGGLGREAFALWTDYVFREHGVDVIYCETWSGNERMLRVAAALGFGEVGRRKNHREVRGKRYDAVRLAVEQNDFRRSIVELGIVPPE